MLKVFLVEDESFIREGLRDNIPWEKYGYTFVGEASDGEMALPLIRKLRPDVLITDIKMPFLDGLALSRIVQSELPQTRIIIISGYDDFEYARQAIEVGVEQYLLKPNDIVFARTGGSTGRYYFYDGTDGEFVYAGFLIKFSIDSTKVNPRFIKYYCLSQEY